MENPEPRAQYLNIVLRQIERTALRIPRFQRDFVWGEKDVLDLLESIQKGYPIGSILTWKVERDSEYFSGFREVPFPPADQTVTAFEVILDGAQRLSSLYGCLRNPEADRIYDVSYDLRGGAFVHTSDLGEAEPWFVPMDALFDSRKFLAIQGKLTELEDGDDVLRRALDLYSIFQDYQIPIIALSSATLEDVVEVFRRVNSTGTALSPVDFVRALTWRSSFDLEETFEEFADRYQATPLEGLTDDFLVKCLAITAGLSLDARDVVRLKRLADREGALANEVESMRQALDAMAELLARFQIRSIDEVPYEVQRLLLFGLMSFSPDTPSEQIEDWFWRSTFAEEHQGKPESYVSRLIREMRGGNAAPALAVRRPVDDDLFAARVRRTGTAVATGFELLLRRTGARSLLSGEPVVGSDALHGLLFTRSELEADFGAALVSAQILANLVLLTPDDASAWKTMREQDRLLIDEVFAACEARTGEAAEIWATQGIFMPLPDDVADALYWRSVALLGRVLPMTDAEDDSPASNGAAA